MRVTSLSAPLDQVLDVLRMKTRKDSPEEFPIHAMATVPFIRNVVRYPGDSDSIGPDRSDRQLRSNWDVNRLDVHEHKIRLAASHYLLQEMHSAMRLTRQEDKLQREEHKINQKSR